MTDENAQGMTVTIMMAVTNTYLMTDENAQRITVTIMITVTNNYCMTDENVWHNSNHNDDSDKYLLDE